MEFCGNFVTCEKTPPGGATPRGSARRFTGGERRGEFLVPDFREGEVESASGIRVPEGGGFLNRQGERDVCHGSQENTFLFVTISPRMRNRYPNLIF